jgi:nucleoside-diphosphate-sugar epimerase
VEAALTMRILITGATGFLGRATVRELVGSGHAVRAIVRDASRAARSWPGGAVDVIEGDPADPRIVGPAAHGMDAVVHLAATYRYDRDDASSMSANAALARAVLDAAGSAGVGRVVDMSSLVVFAVGATRVDETTPLTAPGGQGWTDPYLRSKVEAELVGREAEAGGLPRITLHPGTIVGPDDAPIGPSGRLLLALLRGGAIPDSRSPFVDVREVARAVVLALDARPRTRFCLTSGVAVHRQTAALLDEITGRRPRRLFLPAPAIRAMARLNDVAGGRLGPLPESGRLDFLLDSARTVDTTRSTAELGLIYRPFRETLADTIRWWAANGVIDAAVAGRLAPAAPAQGAA